MNPPDNTFTLGDIFYTQQEDKFNLFKLIKFDAEFNTYHVKIYAPVASLPAVEELDNLSVIAYHAPIDKNGFENPTLLYSTSIEDEDLIGYLEYIKQTGNVDEVVQYASKYYKEAYQLSNQKKHEEAIGKYSKAIELIPHFFEAIDNRAFCKMDLGRWKEAIEDFKRSLVVNPNSFLAIFSIGECYFKSSDYAQAKDYFEQAILINPEHELPRKFLAQTLEQLEA